MKKTTNALLQLFSLLFITAVTMIACSKDSGSGNSPKISSISPSSALTGDVIVISGKNLSSSTVLIGGISSYISNNTETTITTEVPSGATTGSQEVVVENSEGKAKSKITVTGAGAPPIITSITPAEVSVGQTITIAGTGLKNAVVQVYKKLATINANTATSITVVIPSGIPAGQAAVDVTTALGHTVSSVIIK